MKQCPDKHHSVLDSDNFCWMCGKALVHASPLRCTCGQIYGEIDKFCKNCGKINPLFSKKEG